MSMHMWRRLLYYLQRDRFDHELEEELPFHLEMKVRENVEAGMSEETLSFRARHAAAGNHRHCPGRALSQFYEDQQLHLFLSVWQRPRAAMTLLISVQSASALAAVTESVRGEIAQLDARLPVMGVQMAEENMSFASLGPRVAVGNGFGVGSAGGRG